MSLNVFELFGFHISDRSKEAKAFRSSRTCPFINSDCTKLFRDGERSGVCSIILPSRQTVICCPNRMYSQNYAVLRNLADNIFGAGIKMLPAKQVLEESGHHQIIAVFGKKWGHELRLPSRRISGGYFMDWILALLGPGRTLLEFIAVEIQTIDTTGSYREERDAIISGASFSGRSVAGLNWENVSKRILPQLIYKGHVLRREPLCRKGLFFLCPTQVHMRIMERLGSNLLMYAYQPGALSFQWYDLSEKERDGQPANIEFKGQLTTTVDQVAVAFTSPTNLPEAGVYESSIRTQLDIEK